jgi:hypothetical protein
MPVPEQLKQENRDQLFSEVNEEVANQVDENQQSPKRQFTVPDMWHRQRQMRSASDRMRRWSMN